MVHRKNRIPLTTIHRNRIETRLNKTALGWTRRSYPGEALPILNNFKNKTPYRGTKSGKHVASPYKYLHASNSENANTVQWCQFRNTQWSISWKSQDPQASFDFIQLKHGSKYTRDIFGRIATWRKSSTNVSVGRELTALDSDWGHFLVLGNKLIRRSLSTNR